MVQNTPKTRGRPRHFDADEALDKAMRVFWTKGYDGATIDDLVAATGVVRPSLYAIFGDKEALFLRCLEHYIGRAGKVMGQAFDAAPNAREAIRVFLIHSVENAAGEGNPKGCLMGNVASVVADANIREFTVRSMAQPVQLIERRLQDAVAAGELPASFPCAQRARQIVDFSMGLALRARLGTLRKDLLLDAEAGGALFFTPA